MDLKSTLKKSLLSDKAILEHMKKGTIIIEPFCRENLSTSSYDVTLGNYYFRELRPAPGMAIYNPYSQNHVERVWGQPLEAECASDWVKRTGTKLENIGPDDRIIWISPGETILAHTIEWLGGRGTVTTMMKARSSMGRNFIEVCKCAGWGDVGYVNRWTMEVTNNSRYYSIPLVVGRRIAQIVFFDTDGTVNDGCYTDKGKYQSCRDVEQLKLQWRPTDCLPKMYKDREIQEGPILDPYPFTGTDTHLPQKDVTDLMVSRDPFSSPPSKSQKISRARVESDNFDIISPKIDLPRRKKRVRSLQEDLSACDSPFSQSSVSSPSSPNSVASLAQSSLLPS